MLHNLSLFAKNEKWIGEKFFAKNGPRKMHEKSNRKTSKNQRNITWNRPKIVLVFSKLELSNFILYYHQLCMSVIKLHNQNLRYFTYLRLFIWYTYLTWSLNKRQTIRTMVQEVLMSHMAHVGLPQAQFAQKYFWPRWGPSWGCGGVQSWKIGSL